MRMEYRENKMVGLMCKMAGRMILGLFMWGLVASGSSYAQGFDVTQILADDGADFDSLGFSVSISGDTAIIGAPLGGVTNPPPTYYPGAAYIYVRNAQDQWVQQAKLVGSGLTGNELFGWSVSISGDTAVVGVRNDDDKGANSGSVYVFVRDGLGQWSQQEKLTATDGFANQYFGWSVSVSGDALIVGAIGDDDMGAFSGSTYFYDRGGLGQWTETLKLSATDGSASGFFGVSVSLSGDKAVVGASGDNSNAGAAYVFTRDGQSPWSQQEKLMATDATANDTFGYSVSIFGDAVGVGARDDSDNGASSGSAYVFMENAQGSWNQKNKLTAFDGSADDQFGTSVSISVDRLIVGAPSSTNSAGEYAGSAYVFVRDAQTNWNSYAKIDDSNGALGDGFGTSVSVSDFTFLAGASNDDDNGQDSGSAFVFDELGRFIKLAGDLAFGQVFAGTSATNELLVINQGTSLLSVTDIAFPTGFSGDWSSGSILPGATQNVFVVFTPLSAQAYGGNVSVQSDAEGGLGTLSVSGEGVNPRTINLAGDFVFGSVPIWDSAERNLLILNAGSEPLSITDIVAPSGFSVDWTSGTIPAGESQPVTVTFSPTAELAYSGNLVVESDAEEGINTIALSGNGIYTRIIRLSGNIEFGRADANSSGVWPQRSGGFTIYNDGNSPLTVNSPWSGTIPTNGSHSVAVSFNAQSEGIFNGSYTVSSDATGGANSVQWKAFNEPYDPQFVSDYFEGWFRINNDFYSAEDSKTTTRKVDLDIRYRWNDVDTSTGTGGPPPPPIVSERRISEDPTFSGVPWTSGGLPSTYELSAGNGTKTLYVDFKWEDGSIDSLTNSIVLTNSPVQASNMLLDSGGDLNNHFGYDTAISGDTALIRASGSTRVYGQEADGTWLLQTNLLAGSQLSISGDTALIDANVFSRDTNGLWIAQAPLVSEAGVTNNSTYSDISGDTIIVQNPYQQHSRAATVYVRDELGQWNQQAELVVEDSEAFYWHISHVAISGDTAAIMAVVEKNNYSLRLHVYVFGRDSQGEWTQRDRLTDDSTSDGFGNVALNYYDSFYSGQEFNLDVSGDIVVFPGKDNLSHQGIHAFKRGPTGLWGGSVLLTEVGDNYSLGNNRSSVAVSGDTVAIGKRGGVLVYSRSSGAWNVSTNLVFPNSIGNNEVLQSKVAISGGSIIAGLPFDDHMGHNTGSAYTYELTGVSTWKGELYDWANSAGVSDDPLAVDPVMGQPIILSYALGWDPGDPSSWTSMALESGGGLELKIPKRKDVNGITWRIQCSDDLITWHDFIPLVENTEDINGTQEMVTIPLTDDQCGFYRYQLEL